MPVYPRPAVNDTAATDPMNALRRLAMNTKILGSLAAALVVTSLALPATAQSLGEHPAVVVARTWSNRGIDPNTFIVLHPAGPIWLSASPTAKDKAAHDPAPQAIKTASASSK
jgi:hypothetical protein